MSRYAVDEKRRALIVFWGTGSSDLASTVAQPDAAVPAAQLQQLKPDTARVMGLSKQRVHQLKVSA
ncbi:hypothetical protein AB0D67_13745 [Streptosporangium sp. NPDC048047]|uniref:hypothetical protein n=1 Tax=Streptosporangium sp. NPDC048047 TaxID=3155748 RepID=UPI003415986C